MQLPTSASLIKYIPHNSIKYAPIERPDTVLLDCIYLSNRLLEIGKLNRST